MTSVRRATGPLLAVWLVATLGAVGVAWFGVHPVTELGFGERPAVPRPKLADSPPFDSNDPSQSLSRHVRNPTVERRVRTSPRPWATGRLSPTTPAGAPEPSISPWFGSATPTPVAPSATATAVYQEASTEGGTATFEYTQAGAVNVLDVTPNPGWVCNAYRYARDWVEVEFHRYGHRSLMVAYLDRGGAARVYTVEQQTP
jgi:hypothetical protein